MEAMERQNYKSAEAVHKNECLGSLLKVVEARRVRSRRAE